MEKNAASRNEKLFIVPEYGRRVYTGIVPLAPRPFEDGEDGSSLQGASVSRKGRKSGRCFRRIFQRHLEIDFSCKDVTLILKRNRFAHFLG